MARTRAGRRKREQLTLKGVKRDLVKVRSRGKNPFFKPASLVCEVKKDNKVKIPGKAEDGHFCFFFEIF